MKKILFAALFISVASLGWSQTAGSDAKKWELQLQGGLSLPVSPYFANGYSGESAYKFNTGFNFGGAVGYKISPQLSVLANIQLNEFRSKTFPGAGYNEYYFWDMTNISLLLKYRILTGPFTPFVFAGPGIVLNMMGHEYLYPAPTPSYENYSDESDSINPMLQAGLGAEYALSDDFSVFAQATYTVDFIDGYGIDYVEGADVPTRYDTVQAGAILNL